MHQRGAQGSGFRAQRWIALCLLVACACARSVPCPSPNAAQLAHAAVHAHHHPELAHSAAGHAHSHAGAAAHAALPHSTGHELALRAPCPCGCDSPMQSAAAPGQPGRAYFLALAPPDLGSELSRSEAPELAASLPAPLSSAIDPIPRIS